MRLRAAAEEQEEVEEVEEEEEEDGHLPLGSAGPAEDKAAGDELRDDRGAEARSSSEQSGLSGGFSSFSILAHHFDTSSASSRADSASPPAPLRLIRIKERTDMDPRRAGSVRSGDAHLLIQRICEWPRARLKRSDAAFTCSSFSPASQSPRIGMLGH
ncbi:unnamed protein product [Pleuronectes platessa]|uniref:Uncharacterized protein n=1 Tax=Pleuronectes platessa TaxID=8262 RepID=A0A9N7TXY3_PLEPL|nr:unnamed protein product [Pleuronectes platessa]